VYGYYIAIEVPKEYKLPKEVKKHIMKTLGKLENLAVKTSSLEEYRNLTEKEVHYLNFVGNPGAKIYISVAEDKSKDWKLRFLIIQVMASLDIALVKNSLIRIAEDDGEEMVLRQAAILALGLTKAKEVRPFLEKILKNRGVYPKELCKTAKIALGYLD
jgi:HEAT repeat protein